MTIEEAVIELKAYIDTTYNNYVGKLEDATLIIETSVDGYIDDARVAILSSIDTKLGVLENSIHKKIQEGAIVTENIESSDRKLQKRKKGYPS